MHRYDPIGNQEVWSPERRNERLLQTAYPACRPVGARFKRNGSVNTATHLDKPRYPFTKIVRAASTWNGGFNGTTNVTVGPAAFLFGLPNAGALHRIACRDALFQNADYSYTADIWRIRIRQLTVLGVEVAVILSGQNAASRIPFDYRDLNVEHGNRTVHFFEVSVIDPSTNVVPVNVYLLSVMMEFALDLTSVGV